LNSMTKKHLQSDNLRVSKIGELWRVGGEKKFIFNGGPENAIDLKNIQDTKN